jgi:cytochrome c553
VIGNELRTSFFYSSLIAHHFFIFFEEQMKRIAQQLAIIFVILFSVVWFGLGRSASSTVKSRNALSVDRDAATVYKKYCASCHGSDGRAKTFKAKFNHARDLTEEAWQSKVSDERIFNVISNGRGKMPGFAKKLSQAEIESLVPFVRGLKR